MTSHPGKTLRHRARDADRALRAAAGQSAPRQPLTSGAEQRSQQQQQQELRRRGRETALAAPPHGWQCPGPAPGLPAALSRAPPARSTPDRAPLTRSLHNRGSSGDWGLAPPGPGPAPEEGPRRGSPRPAPPQRRGTSQTFAEPVSRLQVHSETLSPSSEARGQHRGESPVAPLVPLCRGRGFLDAGGETLPKATPVLGAVAVPNPAAPPRSIAADSRLPGAVRYPPAAEQFPHALPPLYGLFQLTAP